MLKSIFKKSTISILITTLVMLCVNIASAQNYEIENDAIDQMGQEKESDNYKMNDALGQTASGEISGSSYKIQSGIMYYDMIPLSFTISDTTIDFGSLTAQTPSTGYTDLTVITNSPEGYQVTAFENYPMRHTGYQDSTNKIPYGSSAGDDLPFNSITESVEGAWDTYSSQFGFGFTLSNLAGSDAEFTSGYREFADDSYSETPQAIMSKNGSTTETGSQVRVTCQVNIDTTQPAGTYQNTVTFILTTTF